MKNKKCPERKFCFSYKGNACEGCAVGDEILKLHKRIDRLKKQNETFLFTDGVYIGTVYYSGKFGFEDYAPFDKITHWMPLPEPPMMKGGAE